MMSERTILVADDNGPLRELFVQQLREYYRVRGVGSGDALLDVLDPSVDAVVCDWKLSGTQKDDLLDAIEEAPSDPAVIVISGSPPRRVLRTQRVAECLEKPIQTDTLRDSIRSAIEDRSDVSPTRAQTCSTQVDKREAVPTDPT